MTSPTYDDLVAGFVGALSDGDKSTYLKGLESEYRRVFVAGYVEGMKDAGVIVDEVFVEAAAPTAGPEGWN